MYCLTEKVCIQGTDVLLAVYHTVIRGWNRTAQVDVRLVSAGD